MYRVTVTTRVLNDKDTLRLSAPILVWLVLFFIIFGVMCIADISFLVLPMFLEFLCIIPVAIWSIKKARKLRQESFDVMLTARDGSLYKDDMKLNVSYSERDNEVYLDDMHDAGKYNHHHITFFATIGGDEVGGFIAFCRENNVQVEV